MANVANIPSGKFNSGVTSGSPSAEKAVVTDDANKLDTLDVIAPKANGTLTGVRVTEEVTFTEDGDTTYTGTVTVPAGAWITDIRIRNVALWDDGTSASMIVGDVADPDGYYTAVDLKATDVLADEVVRFESTGGVEGAYIVVATGEVKDYDVAARVISGVITTGAQDGTAGRTRLLVEYIAPGTITAATGVA